MDLILWRHCEAEPGEPDLGRRLTSKGTKQAERMAEWLERHLPDSCRILVSLRSAPNKPRWRCNENLERYRSSDPAHR